MKAMVRWSIAALTALFLCMFVKAATLAAPPVNEKGDKPAASPAADTRAASKDTPPGDEAKKDAPQENASASELKGKVLLPSEGDWLWWVEDADGNVTAGPTVAQGEQFEWTAEAPAKPEGTLRVLNRQTGNIAALPLADAADKEPKLVDADFSAAHRLKVKVTGRSGEPVAAAFVRLTDSEGNVQTQLIAETDRGEAVFHNVALGKATIEARSGDVGVTQEVRLERERKAPEALAEVVLAGDVPTVPAGGDGESAGKKEERAPAYGARTLQAVVSLIILAAVVVILAIVLKNRRVTLRSALQKAGIAIEEDQPAATPAPVPPGVPPLDPDLVGPAPTAPPTSAQGPAAAPSGPKLVGVAGRYAGVIFPVKPDVAVIGREMTCDIALTDDATTSRRHATISRSGDAFVIQDEGSSNGTLVNGLKITERPLKNGDEVQIGSTRFRFEA
ncbi:MAG: FHA domain-containing protein [Armatimonadota bacterium]